ncbi:hypothetical protein [Nannocystis punicea]|uniref:Uncharacterized protein n=1 Tax=Nannocystis punicea TaxID=2995304 RepID=A0ABY7HAJ8_9BACT|nr:hypothetical protein [Nannocystis poenicansa]WAS96297.1 hypothetical protein O0S08_09055 [Nannocystis poenicansa]
MVSSQELHPSAGARFVCEREPGESLRYRANVYVAGGATITAALTWDQAGQATLAPVPDDPWVANELLKLARVLKHSGQARLVRWRG